MSGTSARSLCTLPPAAPLSPRPAAHRPLLHAHPLCSIWDDGTANPEPALDQFTLVGKYEALGWLLGGLSIFGVLGTWAVSSHPEKRVPWVS